MIRVQGSVIVPVDFRFALGADKDAIKAAEQQAKQKFGRDAVLDIKDLETVEEPLPA